MDIGNSNVLRVNGLDTYTVYGRFSLGASGAVTASSEKGLGWTVAKGAVDSGEYAVTLDDVNIRDVLYADAQIIGDQPTLSMVVKSIASGVVTFLAVKDGGTPADATDAQLGSVGDICFEIAFRKTKVDPR